MRTIALALCLTCLTATRALAEGSPQWRAALETCRVAFADPRIDPVRGVVAIADDMPTQQMMQDDRVLSDEQKQALLVYMGGRKRCSEALEAYEPKLHNLGDTVGWNAGAELERLIRREVTIGDYNTRRYRAMEKFYQLISGQAKRT